MSEWTIHAGGRILRNFFGTLDVLNLNVLAHEDFIEGVYLSSNHYVENGKPLLRPSLGLPPYAHVSVNDSYIVGVLPPDTGVYLDRKLVGTTDGTELVLSFPLAQTYSVKFDPPFPYKPHEMEIVVNEANT